MHTIIIKIIISLIIICLMILLRQINIIKMNISWIVWGMLFILVIILVLPDFIFKDYTLLIIYSCIFGIAFPFRKVISIFKK